MGEIRIDEPTKNCLSILKVFGSFVNLHTYIYIERERELKREVNYSKRSGRTTVVEMVFA